MAIEAIVLSIQTKRLNDCNLVYFQTQVISNPAPSEFFELLGNLRRGVWVLGISSWLFGIADRSIAAFADGFLSATDLVQLLTASFFALSWVLLKPQLKN